MIRNIILVLDLARWQNCLITTMVVIVAVLMLPVYPSWRIALSAALGAASLTAYGNIINDLADCEADKQNHPARPLPSGKMQTAVALIWAILFLLAGLMLSALVNWHCFAIGLMAAIMLGLYSRWIQGFPLLSNIWVALIGALTFVYAGLIVPGLSLRQLGLVGAGGMLAFWFHLGREIVKDLEDCQGDQKARIKTLATLFPAWVAKACATTSLVLMSVAVLLLYFFLKLRSIFIVTFLLGIAAPLVAFLIILWKTDTRENYRLVAVLMKMLMPVGLLVLLSARF